VIDANSGIALSGQIGRIFADAETEVRAPAREQHQ